MRGNSSIIGPVQTTSISEGSGRFDLYDCHSKRVDNTWPIRRAVDSIIPNSGNTLEGATYTFTVTVSGYNDGDTIYYSIVAVSGTINASDFTDASTTGSFTVNSSGVGSFVKTLTRDATSETDSYKIQIRDGSVSGTIIGESGTFTIPDPVYTLTWAGSSVDEGTSVSYTITGTNVVGGTHYLTLSNTAATPDDAYFTFGSAALSQAFVFNGTSYTAVIGIYEDYLTEGSENLTLNLRVNSTTGPIVASDTIIVNDTSLTPSATVTPSVSSVNEGSSVTFTVSTTNFASGTLNWDTVLSSDMEPTDISATSGTVSISSSTGSIVITATSDGYTETGQTESFQVRIYHPDGLTVLATSTSVTINDTSTGTPEPLGIDITSAFYEISNRFIPSDTYMNSTFDYNGPYDVGEVQTDFSGTGRVYIGHKVTSGTAPSTNTFYSDVPIAGVQILNSAGTSLLASWIFNTNTGGSGSTWQTYTVSISGSSTQGFPVTPATASGYSYLNITTTLNINRFSWATGTSSQYTGAADGIGNTYKLTADGGSNTIATVGNAQISQTSGTYYAFRETSGTTLYSGAVMRSPTYSFSGGERIRVIHALTGNSLIPQDPDDSLYVAVY